MLLTFHTIAHSLNVSELMVDDLWDMIKDMLQGELKALVLHELKVVVLEELGDRLDGIE